MEKKKKKHTFRKIFYFFLIILITLILCSTSTKTLKVKEYKIINSKINENHNGLKIIHFSDLHYGDTIKLNDLKTIVKEINLFNPDIIIFTGDLINSTKEYSDEEIKNIINELNKLKPNIESYLIKGNHDYNELFESSRPDAILVCTPPNLHYDVIEKASQKGIHVFAEKPFTTKYLKK